MAIETIITASEVTFYKKYSRNIIHFSHFSTISSGIHKSLPILRETAHFCQEFHYPLLVKTGKTGLYMLGQRAIWLDSGRSGKTGKSVRNSGHYGLLLPGKNG